MHVGSFDLRSRTSQPVGSSPEKVGTGGPGGLTSELLVAFAWLFQAVRPTKKSNIKKLVVTQARMASLICLRFVTESLSFGCG